MTNEDIRSAAAAMGSKGGKARTEAKRIATAQNLRIARAARKLKPCQCDAAQRTGDKKGQHRSSCPVYKRQQRAAERAANATESKG